MRRIDNLILLLLIVGLSIVTGCSRPPSAKITEQLPASPEPPAFVPLSEINLAAIGSTAPKGRLQDRYYNNLPIVSTLIAHGKESIPYLISKLDDDTKIEGHVIDYWSEVRVGDVALVILTDFFTDGSWQHTTIPGVSWDEFLERGANRDLTAEQVLRNYISRHGRKEIQARWQKIWGEYRLRLVWDENERCFKVIT